LVLPKGRWLGEEVRFFMNRVGDNLIHFGANEVLIRAFVARNVEFVIIGGLAVAWYCASRQADDMDLFINNTPENSERIFQSLISLNLRNFAPDSFVKLGLQVQLKQTYYAELLTAKKDGLTYAEVVNDAVEAKVFNIPVQLASVASLIRLKELAVASEEAQIDKHLKDIECLKKYT
jgi:hypothetical protein